MPTREDWLPYSINERKLFLRQFATNIPQYATVLGLTQAEVDRIHEISEAYSFAVDLVEIAKVDLKALVAWRDHIISGEKSKKPAPNRPTFNNSAPPAGTTASLIAETRKIVRRVKNSMSYEPTMGIALGILPPNHVKTPLRELKPQMKVTAVVGFKIRIACEKKGMTALAVEYRRKCEEKWQKIAFLTTFPETIYIEPAVAGVPETIEVRGNYVKANKSVGEVSNPSIVTICGM
ncbi:MAG TPA: hypothetical protein PKA82_03610 [Pyrinomonadaceae bacterium]|nr:hypothetical protein [Pyrinomonadaceae bacterium]